LASLTDDRARVGTFSANHLRRVDSSRDHGYNMVCPNLRSHYGKGDPMNKNVHAQNELWEYPTAQDWALEGAATKTKSKSAT